ncbi:MAG: helix-turn-helix domain-containing protein [Candidatus Magasanikbacteria bacterium]|nr:helix-turn-helix domain-containing protein [Candidatus Magasanikbacteria bacterium]
MAVLCRTALPQPTLLSERLRAAREAASLSLAAASVAARVPAKYLAALEAGRYAELPRSWGFRAAYLRSYAEFLGLDAGLCVWELSRLAAGESTAVHPFRPVHFSRFASWGHLLRWAAIFSIIALFLFFLTKQVQSTIAPPMLNLFAPREGEVVSPGTLLVQGKTEPEAKLTINGQATVVTEQGTFESALTATPGLNTVTVAASRKHGAATTVVRHIIVRPGKPAY